MKKESERKPVLVGADSHPFTCPVITYVKEQEIKEDQEAEAIKRVYLGDNDRGGQFAEKRMALIFRDPAFQNYSNLLFQHYKDRQSKGKTGRSPLDDRDSRKFFDEVLKKWKAFPIFIRDPLYFSEIPDDGDTYTELYTGKTPFIIDGLYDQLQQYVEVKVYLNPLDKKSLQAAKDTAGRLLEYEFEHMPKPDVPRGLETLYSLKMETFVKYVRWYDLHTDKKTLRRPPFRSIAFWERITKGKNDTEAAFRDHADRKTLSRIPRELAEEYGEDNVEKGVKSIFFAIYRKKYTKQAVEPLDEEYKGCPEHGMNCPIGCPTLKEWMRKFERVNRTALYSRETTIPLEMLDYITYGKPRTRIKGAE